MKTKLTRRGLVGLALAIAPLAIGCGPDYERMEITGQKASPLGGEVRGNRVSVPEGMVVKANIVPYDDDQQKMPVRVFAHDPDVLEVAPTVNESNWVFIGKRPGRTRVEYVAGADTVLIVEADVTPQPDPE